MTDPVKPIILFDLDYTLASVNRRSLSQGRQRLEVYDGIPELLTYLAGAADLALVYFGVRTMTLRGLLSKSDLADKFDPRLVFGATAETPKALAWVSQSLGVSADVERKAVFVSPSRYRRWLACRHGWAPCPHPRLAVEKLASSSIACFHVHAAATGTAPSATRSVRAVLQFWKSIIARLPIVPLKLEHGDSQLGFYGMSSMRVVDQLRTALTPLTSTTLTWKVLFKDVSDADVFELETGDQTPAQIKKLEDALASIPTKKIDDRNYVLAVSGDPGISIPHPTNAPHGHTRVLVPAVAKLTACTCGSLDAQELTCDEVDFIQTLLPARFVEVHTPLCGLDGNARREFHRGALGEDNKRISEMISGILKSTLDDVVRLPIHYYGKDHTLWNFEGTIPGYDKNAGVIILGAHIDSYAKNSRKVSRGADDDGSGITAILLAAEFLAALADERQPRRDIRFVLFNAEEAGMAGSGEYAPSVPCDKICVAMIQLDMIGWYNKEQPPRFEIHGPGEGHPGIENRSKEIGDAIVRAAAKLRIGYTIDRLPPKGVPPFGLSDHGPFWGCGQAACLVSETGMFSLGLPRTDPPSCNPDYHLKTDNVIDENYATAITKAVIGAVWMLAKR